MLRSYLFFMYVRTSYKYVLKIIIYSNVTLIIIARLFLLVHTYKMYINGPASMCSQLFLFMCVTVTL